MPAPENAITTEQMVDGLNTEMIQRFNQENDRLAELLGNLEVETMPANTKLEMLKVTGKLNEAEVAEGEETPLSQYKTESVDVGTLEIEPFRKLTTAKAILKSGFANAVVKTDAKMLGQIRATRLDRFFKFLEKGAGEASGRTLQAALAQADATLNAKLEEHGDSAERIIHFVNGFDIADYLAEADVTTQNAYGMRYLQDFLGVTDIFITNRVPKGTVYVTPVENIHIYGTDYDELSKAGLNYEVAADGLIGVYHKPNYGRNSVETFVLTGMLLFAEVLDYIVKATIGEAVSTASLEVGDAPAFDPEGDEPPTGANTVNDIQAWAKAHDIDLTGKTRKDDMLEAIDEALARPPEGE